MILASDGATVIRKASYTACQLEGNGRVWQIPRVWAWWLVVQTEVTEGGRRHLVFEVGAN